MYGTRLKQVRQALKLTQEQFAKELTISTRRYTSYEREENNPPYFMLELLYDKYSINLNWFIMGQGKMFNAPQYKDVKEEILKEVEQMLKNKGIG